ncbi:polysaccharide biosynthesis protein [Domibacillus indicus]|uniref:polysaccharide biosynthesis protein n=1 Tax=Domibacillus indicus TaxID=1437523 RepID=UPI000617F6AE|nr:nucleoside-diphosphate sugar epimerase/dehydratase [Domibacillus indicus]
MNYRKRVTTMSLVDTLLIWTAVYTGWHIAGEETARPVSYQLVVFFSLAGSYHFFASKYQLYKRAWSYASIGEMTALFKTIFLSVLGMMLGEFLFVRSVTADAAVVTLLLLMAGMGSFRFSSRIIGEMELIKSSRKKKTLIVGAGSAGIMTARQLVKDRQTDLIPTVFVDDDLRKYQLQMLGIPIAGTTNELEAVVKQYGIEHIVIAIPSLSRSQLDRIYQICLKTGIQTQILPRIEQLMLEQGPMPKLEDIQPEDLLEREPVYLNTDEIAHTIKGKTVLVTGAGGSIGSEICRQVCRFQPERLLLLGHGENSIYTIEMELREQYGTEIDILPIIADIQDRDRIFQVLESYRPSVLYHAAAHKHVPLMELNPHEAVKNNIIGTKNTAEAAEAAGVERFVMISSDKAVKPTSVMGASKRLAEMVIQYMDTISSTQFVAVRFGNVLGSRGSVIPLFKKQIEQGGPVTVTHPDMVRYFMTIPEASRLVMQAGALAKGGEVFVLDMGKPVKIVDLAKNLIQLSGYSLNEIGISYTGMRPGEKLYEELLDVDEIHEEQVHPKIYIGKASINDIRWVYYVIEEYLSMDARSLSELLLDIAHHRVAGRQANPIAVNQ